MRTVPLRLHLVWLTVTSVLPLALLVGVGLVLLFAEARDVERHRAIEVSRALAIAVEGELERSESALEIVAVNPAFAVDDRESVRRVVRRALETQPLWSAIAVADADGQPLVHTGGGPGAPDPDLAGVEEVLGSGRSKVGNLVSAGGRLEFPIRVPVRRGARTTHVLTAWIPPDPILAVVVEQGVAPDWIVSVFDAAGLRVARSRAHEQYVGGPPAESLRQLMASPTREGGGPTRSLEGEAMYSAYHRLPRSGWSVAVGLPTTNAAWTSTALYAFAVAVSLLVGLGAAWTLARRIDGAMAELRDAAQALGRGRALIAPRTPILEMQRVGDTLVEAAALQGRAAAEREELLERERAARAEAETASRAKDQFLAMLGHELRNPLAALSSSAAVLERTTDPATIARAGAVIGRQVSHLARLTDDLLGVSRVLLGKIVLRRERVDLAEITAQVLATLERTGRTAAHGLEAELAPVWVSGDPIRLDQVVTNLLVNAVKYTPAGGQIRVTTGRQGADAVLTAVDTGIGIPADLLERVFELFVQGERAIDRADGGLGIGLTLVRRLAELHGGTATAASLGRHQGSTFEVRLPALDPEEQGALRPATPEPSDAAPGRRVLLVEDNADARETLRALLEALGHEVDLAADGTRGLELALTRDPELLLVDLGLPGIDGFELARRFRASGTRRGTLVALTGYGGAEDRDRALAAGFDLHLTKPLDVAVLEALLAAPEAGRRRSLGAAPVAPSTGGSTGRAEAPSDS